MEEEAALIKFSSGPGEAERARLGRATKAQALAAREGKRLATVEER